MHRTAFLLLLSALTAAGTDTPRRFTAQTIDDKISIGYGLAIGDVNGDGKSDILLADAKAIVWYANPDWKKHIIAENLTLRDNVCLAARDLDGDSRVEIAVGAQWNPGETTNEAESGAVFYLQRPAKEGERWTPVRLPHEPTVHRMHWAQRGEKEWSLVVLPLHGRGNVNGAGPNGVRIFAYNLPANPAEQGNPAAWTQTLIDDTLHVTHNFDVRPIGGQRDELLIGGKEAFLRAMPGGSGWTTERLTLQNLDGPPPFAGAGEIRYSFGPMKAQEDIFAIEPFHGPNLVNYRRSPARTWERRVLDTSFNQGHALAVAWLGPPTDISSNGTKGIIAGWREPNAAKQFGIKLYHPKGDSWASEWVCEPHTMACEDLKVHDLDSDGVEEIIAAGRSTHNVVIYRLNGGKK